MLCVRVMPRAGLRDLRPRLDRVFDRASLFVWAGDNMPAGVTGCGGAANAPSQDSTGTPFHFGWLLMRRTA